jgi:hypothetical protein
MNIIKFCCWASQNGDVFIVASLEEENRIPNIPYVIDLYGVSAFEIFFDNLKWHKLSCKIVLL